jgi:hypothetical protein
LVHIDCGGTVERAPCGSIICPRCKGAGEREVKDKCPNCEKGRVPCPDCVVKKTPKLR